MTKQINNEARSWADLKKAYNKSRCEKAKMQDPLNHLLILVDGHRRYARKNEMSYTSAYEYAFRKLPGLFAHIFTDQQIPETSIVYSWDYNFTRMGEDWRMFLEAAGRGLADLVDDAGLKEAGVQMSLVGERYLLTQNFPAYEEIMNQLSQRTTSPKKEQKKLHILFGYSPEKEFQRALSALRTEGRPPEDTTFEDIRKKLYSPNLYNLIIFTGQCEQEDQPNPYTYFSVDLVNIKRARMWISKKLFPEITTEDIDEAIEGYGIMDWISLNTSGRKKFE